jgi:hypothetical protein
MAVSRKVTVGSGRTPRSGRGSPDDDFDGSSAWRQAMTRMAPFMPPRRTK